jgi:predicted RND superfamily exporter protein
MENNNIKAKNTNDQEKENVNEKKTFFPISSDLKNIIFYVVLLIVIIALCYYFYVCSSKNLNTSTINYIPEETNVPIIFDNIQNVPEISCKLENTNLPNIEVMSCKLENTINK